MIDFFFLLLLLFLLAILLRQDWVYYLLYVVGGIYVASRWWTRHSLRALEISRRLDHRAFAGQPLEEEVFLRNRSWLPIPWVHLQEAVPLELQERESYKVALGLGPRSTARHTFRLYAHRRGYFPVGPLRVTAGDLFGFAEGTWQERAPVHVTVYPKVLPLPDLGLPSNLPFGTVHAPQRIFEDPARLAGVRPYTRGDSLRHIHWRASAHEDTLLVKKFQPAIALDTTVVLDLDQEAYPVRHRFGGSEWAITVAASLASHLAERRQAVGLLTNGWDPRAQAPAHPIPSQSGRGHLMTILELLARVQLRRPHQADHTTGGAASGPEGRSHIALAHWLPRAGASLTWGSTLLVITPALGEEALWALHRLHRRGLTVLAILVVRPPGFPALRQQARALGIPVFEAIWASDLREWGLRQSGSPRPG